MDFRFRGNDRFDRFYQKVRNREEVLYRVTENDTDLAIMGRPPEGLGAEKEAFAYHPLGVIAPPDHALAKAKQIPLHVLMNKIFSFASPVLERAMFSSACSRPIASKPRARCKWIATKPLNKR